MLFRMLVKATSRMNATADDLSASNGDGSLSIKKADAWVGQSESLLGFLLHAC